MAQLREARDRVCVLRSELETVVETNRGVTEENMALVEEVSKCKVKLWEEEEKYSALWRMSCEQLVGLDAALAVKEEELESLRAKEGELESLRSRLATLEGSEHAMAIHIGARTSGVLGKGHFVTTGTRVSRVPVGEAVAPVSTLAAAPTGIPVAPRKGPLESHRVRKAGEGPESVPWVASDRSLTYPVALAEAKHRQSIHLTASLKKSCSRTGFRRCIELQNGTDGAAAKRLSSLQGTCAAEHYRNGASSLPVRRLP